MSKGNSELLSKHQSKIAYTSSGVIGNAKGYEVLKEVVIRIRNSGAAVNNSFKLSGRMATDTIWEEIGSVQNSHSALFHIASWDYVLFECIEYADNGAGIEMISSAFFNDGMFTVNAINDMNTNLENKLNEIDSTICDIKSEIQTINRQIELITDHEEYEVK